MNSSNSFPPQDYQMGAANAPYIPAIYAPILEDIIKQDLFARTANAANDPIPDAYYRQEGQALKAKAANDALPEEALPEERGSDGRPRRKIDMA